MINIRNAYINDDSNIDSERIIISWIDFYIDRTIQSKFFCEDIEKNIRKIWPNIEIREIN